jgi:biotin transport system substrate-specific component
MTLCALFAALTAVCSWLAIPIGPVPINLALLPVLLAGGLLGWKYGAISQLVYVLVGAAGAPVFSGFRGGVGVLVGPTGGYIIGYVVCALLVGLAADKFRRRVPALIAGMILGVLALYLLGTAQYLFVVENKNVLAALGACVFPFLPGDAAKIAVALLLTNRLHPVLFRAKKTRA